MNKDTSLIDFCKECQCEHLLESKLFICRKISGEGIEQEHVETIEKDIEDWTETGKLSERPYKLQSFINARNPIRVIVDLSKDDKSMVEYGKCKHIELMEDVCNYKNNPTEKKKGNEITGPFVFGDKEANDDIKKCVREEIDNRLTTLSSSVL